MKPTPGVTLKELSAAVGLGDRQVRRILKLMPNPPKVIGFTGRTPLYPERAAAAVRRAHHAALLDSMHRQAKKASAYWHQRRQQRGHGVSNPSA